MEARETESGAGVAERPGHYVVGQLHDVRAGKEYTGTDGKVREPWVVKVLVVDEVVRVEYRSRDQAQEAIGSAEPGDTVKLRCYLQTQEYKGKALLFFRGAGTRSVDA